MFEYGNSGMTLDARYEANKIAFAPVVFQVARTLRDRGLFAMLEEVGSQGMTTEEAAQKSDLNPYTIKVLFETGLSARMLSKNADRWSITPIGRFLLRDEMTRVNMDFTQDVCYRGMSDFDKSVTEMKPYGLREFGTHWNTIYEALQFLPSPAKESWFAFDHFYSDSAFPELLAVAFSGKPKKIMDIGGNTGKWATKCLAHDANVNVTIVDLPDTLNRALRNIAEAGFGDRVTGHTANMLDEKSKLPTGYDVVWMSQFLCCFSEEQVVTILKKAGDAIAENGRVLINDTFWDRQQHEIAAYCIINTSPYFTALANGNSKMYSGEDMLKLCEKAGLKLVDAVDGIGYGHTVFALGK